MYLPECACSDCQNERKRRAAIKVLLLSPEGRAALAAEALTYLKGAKP